MKKTGVGLLLMLCAVLAGAQTEGQPVAAIVREFSGTVEIKIPGAAWRPAREGERIGPGALVSTGFKSTVLLVLGNSTVTVRPLTRLSLEEIQSARGNESARLALWTGRIRADVKPSAGQTVDFTIRSPIATASVRGTSFDFDGINLIVDDGRVYVAGGNGSAVYVGAGHRAVSDPGTGKTAGAVETTRAELIPDIPTAAAESGFALAPPGKTTTPAPTIIDVSIRLVE